MSTKISQLTSATDITASDLIQIVDVEDGVMAPSGTNKKITAQLLADDLASIVSDGSIATSKLASGALPSAVTVSSTNIVNGTIIDADINASAAIAGSKISPSFTAPSVISVNSSSDALRITQTGVGNALLVDDTTNPDSTPFIINAQGIVISGSTTTKSFRNIYTGGQMTPRFQVQGDIGDSASNVIFHSQNDGASCLTGFARSRGTLAASTALENGDYIGVTTYQGYDGDEFIEGARIFCIVDSPVSLGNVSAGISFATRQSSSAIGERMRITSTGNVGIGTITPSSRLHVAGDLTVSSATVATSATAGANGDVPAQVAGYLVVNINGTSRKIPYYA
jgi:hypothetical protein